MGLTVRVAPSARVTAVLLIVLAQAWPSPARAISPPPIDATRLPGPAPPAPPAATVQREVCAAPAFDPRPTATPGQLDDLDLPAVWRLSRGAGQRVAVIDTGVSAHRRLRRLTGGGDYVSAGDGTQDCDGHGTLVAGIVAATPDPADRFSGVAPDATVIAIRQSSTRFGVAADPSRSGVGDVDTLARAVRTAADLGASVITISSVACAPASAGLDDRALGATLAYAVDAKDVVVVAAAGNTGTDQPCPADDGTGGTGLVVSPAWYDDYVLTVGSIDTAGRPSRFSLPGPWVDVAAPGEAVVSLSPIGDAMVNTQQTGPDSTRIAGTGYAAAVVGGLAALIRSRFPGFTARQVTERIAATAHHPPGGRDDVVGAGAVDPLAAVGTGPPVPTSSAPRAPAGVPAPVDPPVAGTRPRTTALTGTAIVLTVLVSVLAGRAVATRLGRIGNSS